MPLYKATISVECLLSHEIGSMSLIASLTRIVLPPKNFADTTRV
jgi:hypothetical protein